MKTVMVRYKTKPERSDENADYIRAVFDELSDANPEGLR